MRARERGKEGRREGRTEPGTGGIVLTSTTQHIYSEEEHLHQDRNLPWDQVSEDGRLQVGTTSFFA